MKIPTEIGRYQTPTAEFRSTGARRAGDRRGRTKSFVGMLFASLAIVAGYNEDGNLQNAFPPLPELARKTLVCDWSPTALPIARSGSHFCIGRGLGLAVAGEASLRLKEIYRLHAEAYSAAEILHGPVAIVDRRLAALAFDADGLSRSSVHAAADWPRKSGASVFVVNSSWAKGTLPVSDHFNEFLMKPLCALACEITLAPGFVFVLPTGFQLRDRRG